MVRTVFRRARVIRPSDRSLMRLVAVATLIAALSLAGCGRKSGLDAPPSSLPGSPEPQASNSSSAPSLFGPNFGAPAPATTGAAPQNQTAQTTPPPQKKSFFLDWLVN
jgi:predicted small lipoprotein YifL